MLLRFIYSIFAMFSLILLAACGGRPGEQQEAETRESPPAELQAAAELTPEQIGDQAMELYGQGLQDVIDLLADRPAAEVVLPELQELKESYVQRLVELGHKREALSESDRALVDARIREGLGAVPSGLYQAYTDTHKDYMGTEAGNVVAAFNIITQYVNFDLLRTQAPAEAERLGL